LIEQYDTRTNNKKKTLILLSDLFVQHHTRDIKVIFNTKKK